MFSGFFLNDWLRFPGPGRVDQDSVDIAQHDEREKAIPENR